ncbi:MAG: hypothetical protein LUH01_10335 [Parabacteroides gordonii]|nr:hypothetical protein [Parabacteroides gordonii]
MEQGNWNVNQMLHWLDIKIDWEERNIHELKEQMDENFLYYFEYNAENLYKSIFMSKCYKILRQGLEEAGDIDKIQKILRRNEACGEKRLLNARLDCQSSIRAVNMVHFLELECTQQLIKDLRVLADILAQTPSEEDCNRTAKKEEPPERKVKTGIRR